MPLSPIIVKSIVMSNGNWLEVKVEVGSDQGRYQFSFKLIFRAFTKSVSTAVRGAVDNFTTPAAEAPGLTAVSSLRALRTKSEFKSSAPALLSVKIP